MNELILTGVNGGNPLAFLTALGAFRLLRFSEPTSEIRLAWRRMDGWYPVLYAANLDPAQICQRLAATIPAPPELSILGKNLTVPLPTFRDFMQQAGSRASRQDRRLADLAAAFGSEVCEDAKNSRIQISMFSFITGSGHQDFLDTFSTLTSSVTADHVNQALFGEWTYRDKGLSFGWDPADAREYALRWNNPGPEGVNTIWGANRLAFEALAYFPTQPGPKQSNGKRLRTTGWTARSRIDEFTWPMWDTPLTEDNIRSLMSLGELTADSLDSRSLRARGIEGVYRAERVRIGAGANFKVRFRTARSI